VLAQFAARVARALGEGAPSWLEKHRVFDRVVRFIDWVEAHLVGLHGLFLTHSSLQSGFDSDVLTAGLPDRTVEGPDTNAFMVREYRALAELARTLGRRGDAERFDARASRLCTLMERLLYCEDDRGGYYGALQWRHGAGSLEGEWVGSPDAEGRIHPHQSWITLLPLYAGVPSPERARKLINRLLDERLYWGPRGVRTAPREDPLFHQAARVMLFDHKKGTRGPVSNWSGPVWVLSSYYLCKGLMRYGYLAQARELALKTARTLSRDLEATGRLHECYDDEGKGLWPAAPGATFISWNVLALAMLRQLVPEVAQKWAAGPEKG
jgi:putative isomerase